MIIQDEKTTYHALATIFVKQCYESLISVAHKHGGALPVRVNFLLDEFANMPKFKDITTTNKLFTIAIVLAILPIEEFLAGLVRQIKEKRKITDND